MGNGLLMRCLQLPEEHSIGTLIAPEQSRVSLFSVRVVSAFSMAQFHLEGLLLFILKCVHLALLFITTQMRQQAHAPLVSLP